MKRVALLLVAAFALTACGGPGRPVDLAVVTSADRPEPEGSGPGQAGSGGTEAPDCGDPTASLRPNGLGIPAGSTMAKIRERGRLIAGVDQNTYLFGFRNPSTNKIEGFDIDMAKQVAKAIFNDENKIQFKAISSRDRENVLANGDVDIVVRTYTINCERLEKVAFSAVYYTTGQRVLVPKSSTITRIDDLGGKKICASSGSTSLTQIARHPAKPVPWSVVNWSDCLVLLQQGQVSAISTDEPILVGMAAQDPAVKIVGPKLTEEPYGIGIPKANTDMVKFVNAVLERSRGDGSWQQSYNRWIADRLGEPASPPTPKYRD
ncbi:glutamate ABC transporter substrate-binding protein [Kibdelosporangium persicum]|uniref:Periplasmic component of amino acid ABC-type transporter/signal transduction system n=1 Tax=Kibdelosporangium persicum TaxID=2698649 RepID=A0ABX2FD20_9PSEU|nr:glutamate ABC transporter substrate-binding protein [Kibdelosporangium persicum]NRN68713.1 Periplasmic component of amino acid ABC-type transporter/signal transduction system [Kibdelosporangium persicum]